MSEILRCLQFSAQNLDFLSADRIAGRAKLVESDFQRIRLKYRLAREYLRVPGTGGALPYACYFLEGSDCDLDKAKGADRRHTSMEGGGLDRECLLYFSKVSEWGHGNIPHIWPSQMIKDLRDPNKHLDTVCEVWWLSKVVGGKWKSVRRNVPSDPANPKGVNIDWQIPLTSGVTINIEVKRRPGEVVRSVYGSEIKDLLHDANKFGRPSSLDQPNVVCMRTAAPVDRDFRFYVKDWLANNENISAVCCFGPAVGPQSRRPDESFWILTQPGKEYVRHLFAQPDVEDECYVAPVFYPRDLEEVVRSLASPNAGRK